MSSGRHQKTPMCLVMSAVVSGGSKPWHESFWMLLIVLVVYLNTELLLLCFYTTIFFLQDGVNQTKLHMIPPPPISLQSWHFAPLARAVDYVFSTERCLLYKILWLVLWEVCRNVSYLSSVIPTGPAPNTKRFSFCFFEISNILIWQVSR